MQFLASFDVKFQSKRSQNSFQIITTHLTIPILLRTPAEVRLGLFQTGTKGRIGKGINGRIAVGAMIIKTENYET